MRGQVFDIDGLKLFTFGGAASIDKKYRAAHISWWEEEILSDEEQKEGLINLKKNVYNVDHVITHSCPESIFDAYMEYSGGIPYGVNYSTEEYLEKVMNMIDYSRWWFGHFHDDVDIDDKHTLLYENVVLLR